jgi:TRAP-type C4-dicarboxylate transport system permease small subunit
VRRRPNPETAMERLRPIGQWLRRRAENVIAAMLLIMFAAFIVQIVFRYLLNFPIGWTSELTVIMWLWLVLWGAAFVVTEKEEIRFDLIYGALGHRARLVTMLITGLFLIAMYVMSFPAVLDYVLFMKVQQTSYLDIRFDVLYIIYPVFALAVIVRYAWLLWNAVRGRAPEAFDPTTASSGV